MRFRIALVGLWMLLSLGGAGFAQTTSSADQRLDRFEQRLNEIESKYQSDLKARDQEIARLKEELSRLRQQPAPAAPATRTAASADEIERTKQDVLKDIESRNPVTQWMCLFTFCHCRQACHDGWEAFSLMMPAGRRMENKSSMRAVTNCSWQSPTVARATGS